MIHQLHVQRVGARNRGKAGERVITDPISADASDDRIGAIAIDKMLEDEAIAVKAIFELGPTRAAERRASH